MGQNSLLEDLESMVRADVYLEALIQSVIKLRSLNGNVEVQRPSLLFSVGSLWIQTHIQIVRVDSAYVVGLQHLVHALELRVLHLTTHTSTVVVLETLIVLLHDVVCVVILEHTLSIQLLLVNMLLIYHSLLHR